MTPLSPPHPRTDSPLSLPVPHCCCIVAAAAAAAGDLKAETECYIQDIQDVPEQQELFCSCPVRTLENTSKKAYSRS